MGFFENIRIENNNIIAGEEAVIIYNGELVNNSKKIFLHYGIDNWNNVNEVEMVQTVQGYESKIAIPLNSNDISFSFRNELNLWDNNNSANYNFNISPATILTNEIAFTDSDIEDTFFNTDFLLSYNLNQEIRNQKVFNTIDSVMNENTIENQYISNKNTNDTIQENVQDITEFNVYNFSDNTTDHKNTAIEKDLDDTLINYSNFSDISTFTTPNLAIDENGEIINLEFKNLEQEKSSPIYYETLNTNQEIATMLLDTHNKMFNAISLDDTDNSVLGMEYDYSDSIELNNNLDEIETSEYIKDYDLASNLIYFKAKQPYVKMFKEQKVQNIQSLIEDFEKEEEKIFNFKSQVCYADTLRKLARQNLLNLEIEKQQESTNFLVVSPYSEIYAEDDTLLGTIKKYTKITVQAFKKLSSYLQKTLSALEERQ
ncbi:MAG: carbohydrate-binding protein [Clostridium sp.]